MNAGGGPRRSRWQQTRDRRAPAALRGLLCTLSLAAAAGALCAGCGSARPASGAVAHAVPPSSDPASVGRAAARVGFLRSGPVVHLTVAGNDFAVALVGSRTVLGPGNVAVVPGRKWLEADVRVENLQTKGSADIGWLDNALHVYGTPAATGVPCAGKSVFAGLCSLSVGDFTDAGGMPGTTFLDATVAAGGSADVWVLATELEDATVGDDVTLTLAPLVYDVKFATNPIITTDAPSGQVALSAGGPGLVRR